MITYDRVTDKSACTIIVGGVTNSSGEGQHLEDKATLMTT